MILVDSNIILDIMTEDPNWYQWSIKTLENYYSEILTINPIIYAEVSIKINYIEALDEALKPFKRLTLPYEASFLAGKAFIKYRNQSGNKLNVLPDFFIGAHASILDIPLVTRDIARYKTYFPKLKLILP